MWAGIECTVNRVGDAYFDQVVRSGHHDRPSDMSLIAELGVPVVRYPVLWERTAPDALASADWTWPDERLAVLRDAGVEPIVGLLHHGSGPKGTSLLDPAFAEGLAGFARAVATRFPWVRRYTPVNEPLTTARFSALYGHWYPHHTDDSSFCRAVINQCRATILAMRAIRQVNPDAELVTTEDLASTQASAGLRHQADFENERRWLSLDLLCGRVTPDHPLYAWLLGAAVDGRELGWFVENACVPDLMGFNYYLTSERWLDTELERWPEWSHGGNGRTRYADVHASLAGRMVGLETLLLQAWARFGRPIAITEAHFGGARDDQLRWLIDTFDAAVRASARGVHVEAVTAWSMFGSFDWHCLVTRADGSYEPGLYDVRGPVPRPTAIAKAVKSLVKGERPDHPALGGARLWQAGEGPC